MSVAAGWYPDPVNPLLLRWWDGVAWTGHTNAATPLVAGSMATPLPERAIEVSSARQRLEEEIAELERERDALRAQIVETRETMLLQEVGLYQYAHPLDDAAQFQYAICELDQQLKEVIKAGQAVTATKKWAINGSEKEGAKMVADFGKLMLRAYNAEADSLVRSLKPFALKSAIERLDKLRASIAKLGASMKLEVTSKYHALRVKELELTADYQSKVAEEKEKERGERARLKEEELARREYEREQARLEKERSHYLAALEALRARGDEVAAVQAEAKLEQIEDAIAGVVERAANVRAGYVYVISNIGSFGARTVKIGMTRRLEPMDRVRELGDASVPFRFDVHAIIFSEDAVGLETELHRRFATKRVNLVNSHREFFFASPAEVKDELLKLRGDLLSYRDLPEALEWHQSESQRGRGTQGKPD